ncbi:MAG: Crp/Fnr family transcriptional regulator [Bacilli bacterium]|nr:Crp/Fnr family transcriptional regulator [Bacilli bacterium]
MSNIFENIDAKNKYKLLRSFRADTYKYNKNTNITNTVIDPNTICLVIKGSVKIVRNNENGSSNIFDIVLDNQLFGSTIYNLNDADYDIVTLEESEIIIINYNDIIKYSGKNKFYTDFIKNLYTICNDKIKLQNERLNIISKKTIRNKLLEYFNLSFKKNNSRNIYINYSYQELADYLCIDRTAMSRELKNLKDEGFIKVTGKRITLLYK